MAFISSKAKHPADFSHGLAGCLPDKPSEEGVRLSRTSNSNLTTWIEETTPPPAYVQD